LPSACFNTFPSYTARFCFLFSYVFFLSPCLLDNWPATSTGLPSTAGTTASVAFIRKGKLFTGHVGDSAIVLGQKVDDTWVAQPLTLDHKPEDPYETQRIERAGGQVRVKAGVHRVVWNRPKGEHKGPVKQTTIVEEIPFLAVARSLGDLWSYSSLTDKFVVSPEPDVAVHVIDIKNFK